MDYSSAAVIGIATLVVIGAALFYWLLWPWLRRYKCRRCPRRLRKWEIANSYSVPDHYAGYVTEYRCRSCAIADELAGEYKPWTASDDWNVT